MEEKAARDPRGLFFQEASCMDGYIVLIAILGGFWILFGARK